MTEIQILWGLCAVQGVLLVFWLVICQIGKDLIRSLRDKIESMEVDLQEADMRLNITMKAQKEQVNRLQEEFDTRSKQMREKIALYEGMETKPKARL